MINPESPNWTWEVPLSLPEERTEDEQQALLHWLEATTQTESRCIGTQPDENGTEREVWQHTFTPQTMTMGDVADLLERLEASTDEPNVIHVDTRQMHLLRRLYAQGRRSHRAWLRRKRQRRAQQRRHNRGRG